MKKNLLNCAFLLFLSVIWLFPFQLRPEEWIMLGGAAVAYFCLLLIPQKTVAFAAAAAVSVGLSIYNAAFFALFVPGLCACAAFFSAVRARAGVPVKKDGLFLTAVIAAAAGAAGSLLYSFSAVRASGFQKPAFERHIVFVGAAFLLFAAFLCAAVRKNKISAAPREKSQRYGAVKRIAAYAIMGGNAVLAGFTFLCCGRAVNICFFTVLLCVFTVLCSENPALAEALRRRSPD